MVSMARSLPRLLAAASSVLVLAVCVTACNTGSSDHPPFNPGASPPAQDDHGNNPSTATTMGATLPTTGVGAIDYSGDEDYFEVTLQANQSVRIRTQSQGDTMLHLLDSSGVAPALAENDDASPQTKSSEISYTTQAFGTYYVVVSAGPNAPAPPTYTLTIQ